MKKNEANIPDINVKIERILDGEGNTKAYASLTLGNAFAVHGIRIAETEKGLKARMPFRSYKSGDETKYQDVFHAISTEAHNALEKSVLDAYSQALEQSMGKDEPEADQGEKTSEPDLEDDEPEPAMSQQM
ncbi:MAG: hypothetical protein E7298_14405 [Lachnospiraceae bacterium]|nr:hypothetical protein [Lachnospiraceae bacterium]